MVKNYFLIIFLNIFLKFDFRFARRPLVLAEGDFLCIRGMVILIRFFFNTVTMFASANTPPFGDGRQNRRKMLSKLP